MREVIEVIKFTDDLDGSEAKHTILLGLEGKNVEVDASEAHYQEIIDFLTPWIEAGRKAAGPPKPRRTFAVDKAHAKYLKDLRQWVRDNNIQNTSNNGWAYETNTGTHKTYYPVWLYKKYDAYLAEQEKVAS